MQQKLPSLRVLSGILVCLTLLAGAVTTPVVRAAAPTSRTDRPNSCSGNDCWLAGFHFPGVQYGSVKSVAMDSQGNLYIGGTFPYAGGNLNK